MNNLNIPICRAKKIDSDEYVEGYYFRDENLIPKEEHRMQVTKLNPNIQIGAYGSHKHEYLAIDPTTLAIHFPDMLDSQGNKIFASLSEDGKGGDIITYDEDVRIIGIYKNGTFIFKDSMNLAIVPSSRYLRTKAIGIQK